MKASEPVIRTPLVRAIEARLEQPFEHLRPTLDAFVSAHAATGWVVLSDYVVRQQGRAMSAAAFTLMPAIDFNSVYGFAEKTARCDFKDCDRIGSEMCEFITSPLFFTFCFTFLDNPFNALSAEQVRDMLDASIERMAPHVHVHVPGREHLHKKLRQLRQEANAKAFNFRLVGDLLFLSTAAAYIGLQVGRRTRLEKFGWFSDKDKIVEAHNEIAMDLFASAVADYWQEIEKGSAGPKLGKLDFEDHATRPWYDPMLRIADHIAGAVAGWNQSAEGIDGLSPKYQQILRLIAMHPNRAQIIRID
jgi:hypothetical protein